MEAMNAKLGPSGCGVGDTECSPEPWVVEEFNAIQKLRDTGYQGVCATYWSATGKVSGYLKRYRDWLFDDSGHAAVANQGRRSAALAIRDHEHAGGIVAIHDPAGNGAEVPRNRRADCMRSV